MKKKRILYLLPCILFILFAFIVVVVDYKDLTKMLDIFHMEIDGKSIFRLDHVLNARPILVTIAGVLTLALCFLSKGKMIWVLLGLYMGFIILMTLLYREEGGQLLNMNPFAGVQRFRHSPEKRQEIINNVWLFLPFGVLLGKLYRKWWIFLIPLFLSGAIEFTQYVAKIGFCDMSDVLHNTLGGTIGIIAGWSGIRRNS
ncbi:MAG: VanZ family protein [Eubacterium sp.]|nr:VanZ family protein [Eubacterium sp.]